MSRIALATVSWLGLASLSARWGSMAAEGRGRPASRLPLHPEDGLGSMSDRCWEEAMLRTEAMSEFERGCHERETPRAGRRGRSSPDLRPSQG